MIGLREQTVRDALDIDDARARHRWNIPADYSVVADCLLRHQQDRADETCLIFDDDEGSSFNNFNIWRMRIDGSDRRRLTTDVDVGAGPPLVYLHGLLQDDSVTRAA